MPQWFVSIEPSTIARTFMGSVKNKKYQDASLFTSDIRKHNLDPVEYLSDVFRRIKTTAKDKLVDLLEHRWQPATVGVWA